MWMRIIARWLVTALAVAAAVWLVPGMHITPGSSGLVTVAIVAVVLGFVNAIIRPILKFLSCGLIIATLGIFTLFINGFTFMLAGVWANELFGAGLTIDGYWPAFWGAIVVSIVSVLLSVFVPEND